MSDFIKPKKLTFEQEMGVSSHSLKEVKPECVSDEEVAAELGRDYDPSYSQLTHEDNIRNAKERILERRKRESIQGIIKYISKSMD